MNYFHNVKGDGTIVLILAGSSLILLLYKKYKGLWYTSLGALGIMAFTLFNFQTTMSQARAEMKRDLAHNPFKGLAVLALESVQLQWGWALLFVWAGLILAATAMKEE